MEDVGKELLKRKKELKRQLWDITNPATCTHPEGAVTRHRSLPSGTGEEYIEYDCELCGSTKSDMETTSGEVLNSGDWFCLRD